jgi:hypothetical protein
MTDRTASSSFEVQDVVVAIALSKIAASIMTR